MEWSIPVKPRGNSRQATVNHQGARYRKDFPTRAEAERWEAESKAALLRGEVPCLSNAGTNGAPQTMADLMKTTYQRFWTGSKSEKTTLINATAVVDALGPLIHPAKVDETKIDALIYHFQAKGNASATVNRKLAALSRMLTFAYQRGYIPRKSFIERQKESEHRLRWFSEAEEQPIIGFFRHVGDQDMVNFCVISFDAGLRLSETLGLTRDECDLSDMWLRLRARTKNGRPRNVPTTSRVRDTLYLNPAA